MISKNENDDDDDLRDIESKSTSLLSTLSAAATAPPHDVQVLHPAVSSTSANSLVSKFPPSSFSMSALYNNSISSSTTPPKTRAKKDFASVSILSRKRKSFDEPPFLSKEEQIYSSVDEVAAALHPSVYKDSLNARPNLRMLSELALGLR